MTTSPQTEGRVSLYDSSLEVDAQRDAITAGSVPVAVYGLGKMGLPLATVFAETTGNTVGVDIDEDVVAEVNDGSCPVDREPGLADAVADSVANGALSATADPAGAAEHARVHVVIVPTLVEDDTPVLSNLEAAVDSIAAGLAPGDLVCIESTVPPRTCRDVVTPVLESESDCTAEEFGVAFCPERTASGRALRDVRGAYPKVVGGTDDESTRAASVLYDELSENDVLTVSDATTAESVKVFEGVYRDVNIALANELGMLAEELGIDVTEAIDVANTQPYCDVHDPGAGVGGHCIPYYPYFLITSCRTGTPLLRMARRINDTMPAFTVNKLFQALQESGTPPATATVGILGTAYRPGVNETCESPGIAIADLLTAVDIDVFAVDPVVDADDIDVPAVSLSELPDCDVDALVLVTDHEEFDGIQWETLQDVVVIDGRNALSADEIPHPVFTVGVGGGRENQ